MKYKVNEKIFGFGVMWVFHCFTLSLCFSCTLINSFTKKIVNTWLKFFAISVIKIVAASLLHNQLRMECSSLKTKCAVQYSMSNYGCKFYYRPLVIGSQEWDRKLKFSNFLYTGKLFFYCCTAHNTRIFKCLLSQFFKLHKITSM